MDNESIPYEEALALKELGFDELCFGYFDPLLSNNTIMNSDCINPKPILFNHNSSSIVASSPLYQQAFRWFREKYNLLHEITGIHSTEPFELDCRTLNIYNGDTWVLSYQGNSYEEAELACLNKLIEIVKNK